MLSQDLEKLENKKTYGRKVVFLMLVFVGYMAYMNQQEIVESLIWPVTAMFSIAFGAKQPVIEKMIEKRA